MDSRQCAMCNEFKPLDEWYARRSGRSIDSYCISCTRKRGAQWYQDLRKQAVDHLGGKCIVCGFDDIRALCIDHIHGGGTAEFKQGMRGGRLYRDVLVRSDKYQLLCANHNVIKRAENSEWRDRSTYSRTEHAADARKVEHLHGKQE